jgi:hypothetical protein
MNSRLLCTLLLLASLGTAGAETPWQILQPHAGPPEGFVPDLAPWRDPLVFNDGTRVQTAADWEKRRAELLADWHRLLGAWPDLITDQPLQFLGSEILEDHARHRVRFRWTPGEETEGWLLVPSGPGLDAAKPQPAVVAVYYEPDTAAGVKQERPDRDFALQLARAGIVALSIGTTVTSNEKTYSIHYPDIDNATVQPLSMLACAAANAWHALAATPGIDSARIGVTGHSYGGKWSMFASCLFDKFACAAWSDGGIVFDDAKPSINYWEPWYLGWHPRPWRARGLITPENPARGLYPELRAAGRDLHELHVLMAPRPFLVSGGSEDPPARWHPLEHSIRVNKLLGHENRVFMTNRPDHAPNPESNAVIVAFFQHFLQPGE